MSQITRREFVGQSIQGTALAAAAATLPSAVRGARRRAANEKVVLALLGAGGRGTHVIQGLASLANVETKYVCDLEDDRGPRGPRRPSKKIARQAPPDHQGHAHRCSTTRTCTAWSSRRPSSGTRWPRSGPARPARMCTSRSASRGASKKAARWSRPPASTSGSSRPVRSIAAGRTWPPRGSTSRTASWATIFYVKVCNMLPEHLRRLSASAGARQRPARRASTGTSGSARRPSGRTTPRSTATGTAGGISPAGIPPTASINSIWPGCCWASRRIRSPSSASAAAGGTRTTARCPTCRSSASSGTSWP